MKKDLCLSLMHEIWLLYFPLFLLCVWCVCVHVLHSCVPPTIVTKKVLLWGKVIYANTWVGGGWPLWAYVERSPRAFLQFFFFFFSLLVPRRGHDKGADACEDTFHLTACIRWAIPYLYPGATLIMQSHQGILRFTRKCHAIADKVKWQFWSVQGWVYKWSKDVSLSI